VQRELLSEHGHEDYGLVADESDAMVHDGVGGDGDDVCAEVGAVVSECLPHRAPCCRRRAIVSERKSHPTWFFVVFK